MRAVPGRSGGVRAPRQRVWEHRGMPNTPNVYEQQFEYDETDAPGYRAGMTRIGRDAGGTDLVIKEFEIPPGESLCPYHYEYEEEWLLVLEGAVTVRTPDGRAAGSRAARSCCFPSGPAGAHKVANARRRSRCSRSCGQAPASPPCPSTPTATRSASGRAEDHVLLRRADGHVDYYEGER